MGSPVSSAPLTLFDMAQRGLSAQLVRMNAAASNLANAGSVAGSEAAAYRPLRPVFASDLDAASGLSSVRVAGVYQSTTPPQMQHDPGNPLADANGNVWVSPVEMLDSSRQYQNLVEALSTAKDLMLQTVRMK